MNNDAESPLITLGDDLSFIQKLAKSGTPYSAHDVIQYLFGGSNGARNDDIFGQMMTSEERK